jgi:hypothetical protein
MINFLAAHWFDIFLAALTLVLGAAFGPAIERLVLGDRPGNIEAVQGGLTVQQVVSLTSYQYSPSVIIVSPSMGAEWTLSQRDVRERAGLVGFYIALAFGAAFLYLRYRVLVFVLLGTVMTFGTASSVSALLYLARRGVIIGRSWSLILLWAIFLYTTAALDIYLLLNPVFAAGNYRDLIEAFQDGGMQGLLDQYHLTGVFFVAFQVFGVLSFLLMAYLLLSSLIFLWSSVNLAVGARGWRLWDILRRVLRTSPVSAGIIATLLALLASLLCSGLVGTWIS